MTWTIDVEAVAVTPPAAFEAAVEECLNVLSANDSVQGAVAYLNTREHSFGCRFDMDVATYTEAAAAWTPLFLSAASSVDLTDIKIRRAELVEDVPAHDLVSADE